MKETGHVLVVGVDGVRFDLLGPESTPSIWALGQGGFLAPVPVDETTPTWSGPCWATIATGTGVAGHAADQRVGRLLGTILSRRSYQRENWTIVVVTDHGHLDGGGHGGREPEVTTAWAAAAGPGIRPGAPPLITRQEEVAPLVLAAAGWPPGQA